MPQTSQLAGIGKVYAGHFIEFYTCVGQTVAQINDLLEAYRRTGVRHILALRGDPQERGAKFYPLTGGFSCARDLARHISGGGHFSVAVAGYPERHPEAASWESEIAITES